MSLDGEIGQSSDTADGNPSFTSYPKMIVNEKVQSLASIVYQEFEKMIAKYDANVVKHLMPPIVEMLECLESAHTKIDELEIQVDMMAEDFEQLEMEYQREKRLRIGADERHIELEDTLVANQEESNARLNNLNSVIKTYECKTSNLKKSLKDKENYDEENIKENSSERKEVLAEIDKLLDTKNALSTVKDDLILTIDKLIIQNEELLGENRRLQEKKADLRQKIKELYNALSKEPANSNISSVSTFPEIHDDDVKAYPAMILANQYLPSEMDETRERMQVLETAVNVKAEDNSSNHVSRKRDEDDNFWDAEGNHFTWAEMELVLQERNQYKVQYIELQEAIRWTANMQAMKQEAKSSRMTLFGPRPKPRNADSNKKDSRKRHFRQNNSAIRRFFIKFS